MLAAEEQAAVEARKAESYTDAELARENCKCRGGFWTGAWPLGYCTEALTPKDAHFDPTTGKCAPGLALVVKPILPPPEKPDEKPKPDMQKAGVGAIFEQVWRDFRALPDWAQWTVGGVAGVLVLLLVRRR